jgi:hypothetical protein
MIPENTITRQEHKIFETSLSRNNCLQVFQDQMNAKYKEMISFHKDEMLDYIKRDAERQQKIMKLLEEIAFLTKENLFIEQENAKFKKLIIEKGKL